jgi:hypothetical protein
MFNHQLRNTMAINYLQSFYISSYQRQEKVLQSAQLPANDNDEFSHIAMVFNPFTQKIRHSIQQNSPI